MTLRLALDWRFASMDISQLVEHGFAFKQKLDGLKASLSPGFDWYPYDSLSNLVHLNQLLTGERRQLIDLLGQRPVLDLCCADGDMAYFLESMGCQVDAVDHPIGNYNGMEGVTVLSTALGSQAAISQVDLNQPFMLPKNRYGAIFFFGALYHVKNPFQVMEALARHTEYCFLSTRIANTLPGGARVDREPIAYLAGRDEVNDDDSNYWIFSRAGLERLLARTHWTVLDLTTVGATDHSDPVEADRDERAFVLARSVYGSTEVRLLDGWHAPEDTGWRWTKQRFSAGLTLPAPARRVQPVMYLYLAPALFAQRPSVTITGIFSGQPRSQAYGAPGRHLFSCEFTGDFASGEHRLDFSLDAMLAPEPGDPRERSLIVASLTLSYSPE
jgi:tRNA (mo5U34)-methyltransferase